MKLNKIYALQPLEQQHIKMQPTSIQIITEEDLAILRRNVDLMGATTIHIMTLGSCVFLLIPIGQIKDFIKYRKDVKGGVKLVSITKISLIVDNDEAEFILFEGSTEQFKYEDRKAFRNLRVGDNFQIEITPHYNKTLLIQPVSTNINS
jgi:hypothetical protein